MSTMTVNRPVRFDGTAEEVAENYATHIFATIDGEEYRCVACDCKDWSVTAGWPCGTEPDREVFEVER